MEASFKTLVKKIEQHSDFEDTQLFRFFREHVPEVQDDIRLVQSEPICVTETQRKGEGGDPLPKRSYISSMDGICFKL